MTGPHMVGRQVEMGVVSAHIACAAEGRLAVLVVTGEPGIGKTTLATAAVRTPEIEGASVLWGSAREMDRRPFGPLLEALGPRGQELVEELRADHGDLEVIDAVVTAVEEASAAELTALVIEDLHWADGASLRCLGEIRNRLADRPVLLLLTARTVPRRRELTQLLDDLRGGGATELHLGPLADAEAIELASRQLGAPPPIGLVGDLERAGGNPLFVLELVEAHSSGAGGGAVPVPDELRQLVVRRLDDLTAGGRALLGVAAVLGARFSSQELRTCLEEDGGDVTAALDDVRRAGLVGGDEDDLGFRHDLVREALRDAMTPDERARLHGKVARRLAAAGAPPMRVAEHLNRGTARDRRDAVDWLRRAARDVESSSPETAVELLQASREAIPEADPRAGAVGAQLGEVLLRAGRCAEADELAAAELALCTDVELRRRLAAVRLHALYEDGRWPELLELTERELAVAGDAGWRGHVLAESAMPNLLLGRAEVGVAAAEEALRLTDEPTPRLLALGALAIRSSERGHVREQVDLAQQAVDAAMTDPSGQAQRRHPYGYLGMALMDLDLDAAHDALQLGLRLCTRVGYARQLPRYHIAAALVDFLRGRWDDGLVEVRAALELVEGEEATEAAFSAPVIIALITAHRGETVEAAASLAKAAAVLERTGPVWGLDWMEIAAAELGLASGEEPDVDRLLAVWELMAGASQPVARLTLAPTAVAAAVAAGRGEAAESLRAAVQELADRMGTARAEAVAQRCAALVSEDPDASVEAAEAHRDLGLPLEAAAAASEAADALLAAGRADEARQWYERSWDGYRGLGAVWRRDRVGAALRGLGVRVQQKVERARPMSGWEALTPTELRIVGHVREGRTNAAIAGTLFISPRTVESHLRNVYRKLGLSSRVELALAASREERAAR